MTVITRLPLNCIDREQNCLVNKCRTVIIIFSMKYLALYSLLSWYHTGYVLAHWYSILKLCQASWSSGQNASNEMRDRERERESLVKSKQVVAFCVSLDLLLQPRPSSGQASPGFTVGVKLNDLRRDLLVWREAGEEPSQNIGGENILQNNFTKIFW